MFIMTINDMSATVRTSAAVRCDEADGVLFGDADRPPEAVGRQITALNRARDRPRTEAVALGHLAYGQHARHRRARRRGLRDDVSSTAAVREDFRNSSAAASSCITLRFRISLPFLKKGKRQSGLCLNAGCSTGRKLMVGQVTASGGDFGTYERTCRS